MKTNHADSLQSPRGAFEPADHFAGELAGYSATTVKERACGCTLQHLIPPPSAAFGCCGASHRFRHRQNGDPLIRLGAVHRCAACLLAIMLVVAGHIASAQTAAPTQSLTTARAPESVQSEALPRMSASELESLVGPIALYPDQLLVQTLAASTYPLEIVQLKQWLDQNKKLKDKALLDAVAQQDWDPSVQALAAFPAVVNKLAGNIRWTTDVGNAFLAQQSDVMDAVQRLRSSAQRNGALQTNDKQTVSSESAGDGSEAITIQPAQRDVVYVPTYNTQYVYRDSGYSDYSGYSGSGGYSSDYSDGYSYIGYAVAAAYGAYWGYYNWRDRYAEVNYNNYYNRNWYNKNTWNNKTGNSNAYRNAPDRAGRWEHDANHRGNAPYANRDLANRYGQANNRFPGNAGNRGSQAAVADARNQLARTANFSRPSDARGAGARDFSAGRGAPNRVGNRAPANWPNGSRGGGFGPRNGDFARAFSARGAHSMGPPSGFRGGPPGGFHGGPPAGLHGGGPPMGGPGMGGPPMGGPPMGGAPPPPPGP